MVLDTVILYNKRFFGLAKVNVEYKSNQNYLFYNVQKIELSDKFLILSRPCSEDVYIKLDEIRDFDIRTEAGRREKNERD